MATSTIFIPHLHYLTVVIKKDPHCNLQEVLELFKQMFLINHNRVELKRHARIARVGWKKLDWVVM
jgi:hypothetical protein